ncbi:ATP-binding protein [Paenibacillus sp. CC-CFT747]|nr:ATP-binding protein [Paenibacillus sp. CC-CFT747]
MGTEYREDKRGTFASLALADTGIGIAAEELPHIFDRFYRADASRTRSGTSGGTGLGLSIANQNVRLHGGWIEVESEPGRGSCFTVYLPLEELRGSLG